MAGDESSVRVALRIRPQAPAELLEGCGVCARVLPGEPCVSLGADRSFTFDFALDADASQRALYCACVRPLVLNAIQGYNATVLAYGQTGSGKTYTMGSGWEAEGETEAEDEAEAQEADEASRRGIIPRAIRDLFAETEQRCREARAAARLPPEFTFHAQFIELYNEDILDLLEPAPAPLYAKGGLRIVEEAGGGGVRVLGATLRPVRDAREALAALRAGALARTTAATDMNTCSSRSHAVFSLHVRQQRIVRADDRAHEEPAADGDAIAQFETLSAKMHFVDLAGSERLKRTGATGERAREGISINCGLLALGNVISALGDRSRRATHVPYRDSKLTRLLQDSLGGNSQTVMIACVSPSDRDFMETLNTLKYANRARNIKNRIVLNQDLSARTIQQLRREVARLQLELLEFRQGKRVPRAGADADSERGDEDGLSDLYQENMALHAETDALRTRLKAMQGTVEQLSRRNAELLAERTLAPWSPPGEPPPPADCSLGTLVQGYVGEIEQLRAKLLEANAMYEVTRRQTRLRLDAPRAPALTASLIHDAKRELHKEQELLARSMGELELQRKLTAGDDAIGERERAEGESADDSEPSDGETEAEAEADDDEDSESKACAALSEELAALSGDIDLKARLIEELELSQQRLAALRLHYEQRLQTLHHQIKATQQERDKVLASCQPAAAPASPAADKVRRVRDEYERRLGDMTRELRRLQHAQRQHAQLARSQATTAQQIAKLRADLNDKKREKVKVMQRMREEAKRHAAAEKTRSREVVQLRKEARRHAVVIRSLQAERQLKDQVLRRKQEEVSLLRRGHRDRLSSRAAGRAHDRAAECRDTWARLSRWASRAALARSLCGELEAALERALAERERVRRELAQGTHPDADAARDHLQYLQQTIGEAQQQIMQLEEEDEEGALRDTLAAVHSPEAGRYALQRMAGLLLQQSHSAARLRTLLQDTQARLRQLEVAAERDTLERAAAADVEPDALRAWGADADLGALAHVSPGSATRCVSPAGADGPEEPRRCLTAPGSPAAEPFRRSGARRGSVRLRDLGVLSRDDHLMTQSMGEAKASAASPLMRVPSAPGGLRGLAGDSSAAGARGAAALSPAPAGETPRTHRATAKPASLEVRGTPPGSPGAARRARDADVFQRLAGVTGGAAAGGLLRELPRLKRGANGGGAGASLVCTHAAEGHAGAVLCLAAARDALYSGGVDRSVREWDLAGGAEAWRGACGAAVVALATATADWRVVAAAAGAGVHLFDTRSARAVATLWSSGAVWARGSTGAGGEAGAAVTCVAAAPAPDAHHLYSAAGDKLRLWDLRKLQCESRLVSGHAAAIMCACVGAGADGQQLLVTGSKDHFVRVARLRRGEVAARHLLEPPHYDGVQSVALAAPHLYSASRDMTLKRWHLGSAQLTHTVTGAHKGWVTGLAVLGDAPGAAGVPVASCGRDGALRLWDAELRPLGQALAADALHALAFRPPHALYTAGNDGRVRCWRVSAR